MLESIIKARLNFKSTRDELEKLLGIDVNSVDTFKTVKFLKKFNCLSDDNKKAVLQTIGGKVNLKQTREYINEKIIHIYS